MRAACFALLCLALAGESPKGYCRFPALHGDTVVFTAEGDLWTVPASGGVARRLTAHPGEEVRASISPDGRTVAFTASYDGVSEVYAMPLAGGLPRRLTWEGGGAAVVGWTPEGRVLFASRNASTLPDTQLHTVDPATGRRAAVPLSQAFEGTYLEGGRLVFARVTQNSATKRYRGGTAPNLWRWDGGSAEAVPLTADFPGTSRRPMAWRGRVAFLSDRDGTVNLWSMDAAGRDLRQHTFHQGWDIGGASISGDRVVYQLGADLRVADLARGTDAPLDVRLSTDLDHTREKWIRNPMEWVTAARLSPSGDRVALTARGQAFVVPAGQGRLVEAGRGSGVRYRDARFMPDGKQLLALSDEGGEVEAWTLPANGVGPRTQVTKGATVLRWEAVPSPDGAWIAHRDKDHHLWLTERATGKQTKVASSAMWDILDLAWSPDAQWLAFAMAGENGFLRLHLHHVPTGTTRALTSDRYDSRHPAWSPDGAWLYFLSERHLQSLVRAPWGPRNPEPFFDRPSKVYQVALRKGLRSPFAPSDELAGDAAAEKKEDRKAPPKVEIDWDGLESRVAEVPLPPGNYSDLATDGKRLYVLAAETTVERKRSLRSLPVENRNPQPETLAEDVRSYELSADCRKLLVWKGADLLVFDAGTKPDPAKALVNLKDWAFPMNPREEWRQMFAEAWRLHRDYFYDRKMHGLDWPAMRAKYQPLADRVTDRAELSDVLAQMMGELSALHTFVRGGDLRQGPDRAEVGALGAVLEPVEGGFRVARIHPSDPDLPELRSPLARPGADLREGDVIEAVNGLPAASVPDLRALLRHQAGKQVLVRVRGKDGAGRDAIVVPMTQAQEAALRYHGWELERRNRVEQAGGGALGYVHLRAMGPDDIAQWARDFYPVARRQGLIVDVRHNSGGNIDSWILEKLLRRAWFYWQPRVGLPYWNMQDAFRGHVVVLCDANTASDGEAFAEGFRRLGLGKVIGTRTWGGEIWLSSSNFLVDRGIATAAETGVYGPEGAWLIEGHGVEPDQMVDNLPHATYRGADAQLDAAIAHLKALIAKDPRPVPQAPPHPDLRWPK
jgi:tricorn protease